LRSFGSVLGSVCGVWYKVFNVSPPYQRDLNDVVW